MSSSTPMPAALRHARANLASASAALARDPSPAAQARVVQLRAEYNVLALEEQIRDLIDNGPALTREQRDRLVAQIRRTPAPRAEPEKPRNDWLTMHEAAAVLGRGATTLDVRMLIDDGTLHSRILPGTNILQVTREDALAASLRRRKDQR